MPLQLRADTNLAAFACAPATRGVVAWNSHTPAGAIEVRAGERSEWFTPWLPLASWESDKRRSHSPPDGSVHIDIDTIISERPFTSVEVRCDPVCDAIALATPYGDGARLSAYPSEDSHDLLVPERTQYVVEGVRTWCSAASTSMLLAYHARRMMHDAWNLDVASVAARVYDEAYAGTGNWTFNMALAGALGLRGIVAYLRDFEHARRFIRAALPLAISYSWNAAELPGAPLDHSAGHIAVLRGFTSKGDPILNDPASPEVRMIYPRHALERLWTGHGGVAYIIAPRDRTDLLELANA